MVEQHNEQQSRALHEWSGEGRNLPTVIFAPPPSEPSVTRGVTGLFVPIFLGLFIILAVYFFAGAWAASQRLLRQQGIARDAAGLTAYMEDLERQNAELCQSLGELPERIERPTLEAQVQLARRDFDAQCQRNQQLRDRLNPGDGARCVSVTPASRSGLAVSQTASGANRRETVREFRARICRSYAGYTPPRSQP
ncbi:MAG: hypothetical protein AB7O04_15375 [Hyphomonadaceae bacterium]